jgi:hypothetical protein
MYTDNFLVGLGGQPTTSELRQGPNFYERLQQGILVNERKFEPAIFFGLRRKSERLGVRKK